MPINDFENALVKPGGEKQPDNRFIEPDIITQKDALKESMFVASRQEPDRHARVLELAQKTKLPPGVVERNFDDIASRQSQKAPNYGAITRETPGLARWLENPDNATIGKDDLDNLSGVDKAVQVSRPRVREEGAFQFGKDLTQAVATGWNGLESSSAHLAAAYGLVDMNTAAEAVASANLRARERRSQMPDYARDFSEALEAEGKDVNKAFERFRGSYDEYRRGNVVKALQDFAVGGATTVGEALDMIRAAGSRPKGLTYSVVENLANSFPSLAIGLGGAQAGAAAGLLTGPLAPAASPILATVGFVGGSFLGQVPVEIGGWINEQLDKRGFDTTNADDIRRAYSDPKLMGEIRGEAERKGVTTASVDMLFNAFAGKLLKGAKGASLTKRAAAGAGELAFQAAGEAGSELAGQIAAVQGDMKRVDIGGAIQEGIVSLGQSVSDIAIGGASRAAGSIRKSLPRDPVHAAEELSDMADRAIEASHGAQAMAELGEHAKKSKIPGRLPGKLAELINESAGGEARAVFFQTDEFDDYWSRKGQSPAKAAEELLGEGGGIAYQQAKESGTPLEIPFGQYVETTVKSGDYDAMNNIARLSADGMSPKEAVETMQALPSTMEELAREASQPAGSPEVKLDESAANVRKNVEKQLRALGQDADQAVLVERMFRTLGERYGIDPEETFKEFNLQITGPEASSEAGAQADAVKGIVGKTREFFQKIIGKGEVIQETAPQPDGRIAEAGATIAARDLGATPEETAALQAESGERTLLQSDEKTLRGRIKIGQNAINIQLLSKANPSTFIHELGHAYLEIVGDVAGRKDAPESMKQDYQTILEWLGAKPGEEISTEQHEQWARGFEAYIMEGKAPSSALKEAFAKFKLWMITVYKNLRSLRVQLTPEVRQVMDRLLATDEEIAAAESRYEPLFKDPESFGMKGEKAERYKKAVADSRRNAEEHMTQRVMADYVREEESWYQTAKAEVRGQVTAKANEIPVYRAISIMRDGVLADGSALPAGTPPVKIDAASLKKEYGFAYPLKQKGLTSDAGMHPELAAESLGFRSADELLTQINAAPSREDFIARETERRMAEDYPDILSQPKELQDRAIKSVHEGADRARVLRLELEYLASQDLPVLKEMIRQTARRVPTEKQVREQAVRTVGARSVNDLKPHLFERAERTAAREAGEALARGDFAAAYESKRKELLNHELYKAAVEAKDDVKKSIKDFRKMAKPDEQIAKTRDMDLVNAARAVLAQHGITKADKSAMDYIEPIKMYDPDTYETVRELIAASSSNPVPFDQMKYDDFVAMADAVKTLWSLAKTSREIEIDGQKVNLGQATEELGARLTEITAPGNRAGYDRDVSKWDRAKMGLMGIRAALRRVESWVSAVDAGASSAVFRKYIWNPISEATTAYRVEKKVFIEKYLDIVKGVEGQLTQNEITAPELGYTFSNKGSLLGAMLHTGNESNLSKLLRGRGWGMLDSEGRLDSSRWVKFTERMQREGVLTKADYDYLQATWDLLEELKPMAQKAHKEMYGHYFNEITANEFETPYGKYRGGYVPAVADSFLSADAEIRREREQIEKNDNSFMFPTAGRGFTKKRVDQYAAPLSLDLRLVPGHIDKVLRFTNIEPAVKSVGRIIWDKGLQQQLAAFDPTVRGDMLVPWLQRAAQQKVETPTKGWGGKAADTFFKEIRKRSGMNVMIGNVVNTLQQFTGISVAMVKVKPAHIRNALFEYVKSPRAMAEQVSERSEFMQTRMTSSTMEVQQTIDDMIVNPTKYEKVRDFAQKHGYFLQAGTQNVVDTVVWTGAYDQAVANGMDEKEAVRSADSAVRETQGSFAAEDISRFETGTPFMRAFTMFYSYFNMQANLLGSEFIDVARNMGLKKGAGKMFYLYAFGFMIPAIINETLVRAMAGDLGDDDDDYLTDAMQIFFGSQFRNATAFLPGIGPTTMAAVNVWNDKEYDDRISTSPVVGLIESSVKAPMEIYQAFTDRGGSSIKKKAIRDTLTLLGLMTGVPVAPLGRPLGYLSEVAEGNVDPTGPIDFARGLVTGKSGNNR